MSPYTFPLLVQVCCVIGRCIHARLYIIPCQLVREMKDQNRDCSLVDPDSRVQDPGFQCAILVKQKVSTEKYRYQCEHHTP